MNTVNGVLNVQLQRDLELISIMKAPAGSHLRTPVPHLVHVETLTRCCTAVRSLLSLHMKQITRLTSSPVSV